MNRLCLASFLLSLLPLAGCVSDEPRHSMPRQPTDVQPTRMGVWATLPEDTDANGFLDTVDVTVYISSDRYPAPIAVPGTFEFKLMGKENKELARWDIPQDKARASARKMPAGPAYFFRLSVLDAGSDKFDPQAVDLTAEFKPVTGAPVRAPLTALRFGRIRP
jgi:hypothetical protein